VLIANNGIFFLFLFKYLATYKRKSIDKRARARKRKQDQAKVAKPGVEVPETTELMTES
jgi:hypothetical protein